MVKAFHLNFKNWGYITGFVLVLLLFSLTFYILAIIYPIDIGSNKEFGSKREALCRRFHVNIAKNLIKSVWQYIQFVYHAIKIRWQLFSPAHFLNKLPENLTILLQFNCQTRIQSVSLFCINLYEVAVVQWVMCWVIRRRARVRAPGQTSK